MVVNNVFCLDKYKPEKNIRFGVFCKFWKKIKVQWGGGRVLCWGGAFTMYKNSVKFYHEKCKFY